MATTDLKRQFGQRVQQLRRRAGLTQEGLAEYIGRSVHTVRNLEIGRGSTRIETAVEIAAALDTTLPELFTFSDEAPVRGEQRKLIEEIVRLLQGSDTEIARVARDQVRALVRIETKKR